MGHKLEMIVITFFTIGALGHSQPNLAETILETQKKFNQLNSSKEIDAGMFGLDLTTGEEMSRDLKVHSQCQDEDNFKSTSNLTIVNILENYINKALNDGMMTDFANAPTESELQDLLEQWSQALKSKNLSMCSSKTTIPYTDGQRRRFIRVNNQIVFSFGYTKPD
jgi:hypothetical protein